MYLKKKKLGNILCRGDEEDNKSNTTCSLGMAHKFNVFTRCLFDSIKCQIKSSCQAKNVPLTEQNYQIKLFFYISVLAHMFCKVKNMFYIAAFNLMHLTSFR